MNFLKCYRFTKLNVGSLFVLTFISSSSNLVSARVTLAPGQPGVGLSGVAVVAVRVLVRVLLLHVRLQCFPERFTC